MPVLSKNVLWYVDLGETDYETCLRLQKQLQQKRIAQLIPNTILFTSHPPVFTLGKRDASKDFKILPQTLQQQGFHIFKTERGGKITYHGPGQRVVYWILELKSLKLTIPKFVFLLEEIIIQTLAELGLSAGRDSENPGVWIGRRKIAALGLYFHRDVSMHGFALNVSPDLTHYQNIVPCGLIDREVTSIEKELATPIKLQEVDKLLIKQIQKLGGVLTQVSSQAIGL